MSREDALSGESLLCWGMNGRRWGSARPRPASATRAEREEEMRAAIVLGTPEQVAGAAAGGRRRGGRRAALHRPLVLAGMDPGLQRASMAVFAREVIPLLRDRLPAPGDVSAASAQGQVGPARPAPPRPGGTTHAG
jgi:hypothetical protein